MRIICGIGLLICGIVFLWFAVSNLETGNPLAVFAGIVLGFVLVPAGLDIAVSR